MSEIEKLHKEIKAKKMELEVLKDSKIHEAEVHLKSAYLLMDEIDQGVATDISAVIYGLSLLTEKRQQGGWKN